MASAPKSKAAEKPVAAKKSRPTAPVPTLRLTPEGRIENDRFEILAIMAADGIDPKQAWSVVPGDNGKPSEYTGSSAMYAKAGFAQPVFQQRVAALIAEKDATLSDRLYGKAIWAAEQVYRIALIKLDLATMQKASTQLLEVAKMQAAADGAGAAGSAGAPAEPRAAGRPATRSPNANRSPAQIRRELLKIEAEPQEQPEVDPESLNLEISEITPN